MALRHAAQVTTDRLLLERDLTMARAALELGLSRAEVGRVFDLGSRTVDGGIAAGRVFLEESRPPEARRLKSPREIMMERIDELERLHGGPPH